MANGFKTGGRQAGTPNRNSLAIRLSAAQHAGDAVELLARLMAEGETGAIKLAAAKELLDRAGGKTVGAETIEKFERIERNRDKPMKSLDEILKGSF